MWYLSENCYTSIAVQSKLDIIIFSTEILAYFVHGVLDRKALKTDPFCFDDKSIRFLFVLFGGLEKGRLVR